MAKKKAIDRLNEKLDASKIAERNNLHDDANSLTAASNGITKNKKEKQAKHFHRKKKEKQISTKDNTKIHNELDDEKVLEQRSERIKKTADRIVFIFFVFASLYVVFLIYGAINTSYMYDNSGKVVPQIMTVEKIEELNEYDSFANSYRQTRMLYEEILTLDYRVAAGVEDPRLIAPEYEQLLDKVELLCIDIQAATYSSKYSQLNNMLLLWVKTDVAVYCQRMSESISQNNSNYAAQAQEYRQIMYNDYSIITSNLITIGSSVEGAEIEDIAHWSPESYVRENIG